MDDAPSQTRRPPRPPETSNAVLPTWGIGSAIWQGVYAGIYPDEFFDDGSKLVQNECGALSTIAGYAKLSDNEEVLTVLVVADFFLDMARSATSNPPTGGRDVRRWACRCRAWSEVG